MTLDSRAQRTVYRSMTTLTLNHALISIAGWQFVATLLHEDDEVIIRTGPGLSLDGAAVRTDRLCDHCHPAVGQNPKNGRARPPRGAAPRPLTHRAAGPWGHGRCGAYSCLPMKVQYWRRGSGTSLSGYGSTVWRPCAR